MIGALAYVKNQNNRDGFSMRFQPEWTAEKNGPWVHVPDGTIGVIVEKCEDDTLPNVYLLYFPKFGTYADLIVGFEAHLL